MIILHYITNGREVIASFNWDVKQGAVLLNIPASIQLHGRFMLTQIQVEHTATQSDGLIQMFINTCICQMAKPSTEAESHLGVHGLYFSSDPSVGLDWTLTPLISTKKGYTIKWQTTHYYFYKWGVLTNQCLQYDKNSQGPEYTSLLPNKSHWWNLPQNLSAWN